MARKRFLRNLQSVAGFLSPAAHPNGIRLGPDEVSKALINRGISIMASAVDGFDPADFAADFDPADLDQLAQDVMDFRGDTVPDSGESSPRVGEDERTVLFAHILTAMQPHLDGFKVYAALARRRHLFPDFVRDFAVRVGDDSTGDPAAWVWVIVDDQISDKELFSQVQQIDKQVAEVLDEAGIGLYPYVLFRTESEQAGLERVVRR